jgi:peptide/nickel transport system ATP-binding protein
MRSICRDHGTAMILITHDIALVGQISDTIAVMHAGHLVEHCTAEAVIRTPRHPYTQGLLRSIPGRQERRKLLIQTPGMMPSLADLPSSCPFHPRCPHTTDRCRSERPEPLQAAPGRLVTCHLFDPPHL